MKNFVLGVVFGIVIASVGFSGIAKLLDRGVQQIQTQTKELAQ